MTTLSTKSPVFRVTALAAAIAACWFAYRTYTELYDQPLEARLIADFKVEQVPSGPAVTLNISGQPMYSAMVVRNVTAKTRGSVLFVTPHLALVGLARPLSQGKFKYQLIVPGSVDEVRFGNSAVTIWKRRK